MNGWLSYIFLSLWLHPQASDIELIYSLTILVLFEFILVHSGVFMSILGRSWKGWLGFILIYGLFALGMNTFVNGNQIIILYGVVVLNRMLTGLLKSGKAEKEQGLSMSAAYACVYFVLLLAVVFGSSYIPRCGLTEAFLQATDYVNINKAGGDFKDMPHIFICFGVMYYLILILIDINAEIQHIKMSLMPSTNSVQVNNEQHEPTILHQFGEEDEKKKPTGCGCSPVFVFIFAAALIAIGVYQRIDNAKIYKNGEFTNGVISRTKSIAGNTEANNLISVTFSVSDITYTISQEYTSDVAYGDTISVVYPPNRPEKAIIAGTKISEKNENVFIWLGIIMILSLTGLIWISKMINKGKMKLFLFSLL